MQTTQMAVDKFGRGADLATVGSSAGEMLSPRYTRQPLATELSPLDTPRKNKRKLSEPKRRTTDFSIKRLCPDSPGSACSDSGRSDESTSEHVRDEPPESPATSNSSPEVGGDRETLHPHLRPPFVFPGMGTHPYFIPQFYYNRPPAFPGAEHHPLAGVAGGLHALSQSHGGLPQVPGGLSNVHSALSNSHGVLSNGNHVHSAPGKSVEEESPRGSGISRMPTETQEQYPECSRGEDNESPDSMDMDDGKSKCRKNYKNMTRERRVEANARERSRVHTISSAFDGLRKAVPSYSYNQKLSKLAILRIACSYINALSKLADVDVADEESRDMTFGDCVDNCTQTIQTEGKARRRH